MKLNGNLKQFIVLLGLSLVLNLGCGQHLELRDQSSGSELIETPEYADFSQFPLPDSMDKDDESTGPVDSDFRDKDARDERPLTPSLPQPSPDKPQVPKPAPVLVGTGIGTVYYLPVYGEKRNCTADEQAFVKDEKDQVLASLCKYEVANCALQGSCFYVNEKGARLFAYKKMVEISVPDTDKKIVQPRFRINTSVLKCPQGMGAHLVCLDPYRTLAADPKFHKIGDVIFIPLLAGKKLPNNEVHDGYFIVRDTGGAIKGEGRFDFYIGFDNFKGHLFSNLKLNDKNSQFKYFRVPEDIAEKVRLARNYPQAPLKIHTQAHASMLEALGVKTNILSMKSATNEFYRMKWN